MGCAGGRQAAIRPRNRIPVFSAGHSPSSKRRGSMLLWTSGCFPAQPRRGRREYRRGCSEAEPPHTVIITASPEGAAECGVFYRPFRAWTVVRLPGVPLRFTPVYKLPPRWGLTMSPIPAAFRQHPSRLPPLTQAGSLCPQGTAQRSILVRIPWRSGILPLRQYGR